MASSAVEASRVVATGSPAIGPKRKTRILLGVTGSVAAVKAPEIAVRLVQETDSHVKILLTKGGKNFWDKAKEYNLFWWEAYEKLAAGQTQDNDAIIQLIYSEDEWREWTRLGDPVMHIALRDWADLLVIAPLSAHSLAKLAHGFCDDALSSVARAWDWGHGQQRPAKPVVLAPAMNTAMWDHPLTATQLRTVQSFWKADTQRASSSFPNDSKDNDNGVVVVQPQVKTLACGEQGNGALAPVKGILDAVQSTINSNCKRE